MCLQVEITMNGKSGGSYTPASFGDSVQGSKGQSQAPLTTELHHGTHIYRLEDMAYTRSGDKGNNCNIGNTFYNGFVVRIYVYKMVLHLHELI